MTLLEQIRDNIRKALEEKAAKMAEIDAVLNTVETEGRSDLTTEEQTRFAELRQQCADLEKRIDDELRPREAELAEHEKRKADTATALAGLPDQPARTDPAKVKNEPRTYSLNAERSQGVSFLRDVMNGQLFGDIDARDRLARHMREAKLEREARALRDGIEARDVGTGAFAGLTVPQYLTELVAPVRRAGRPVADIANSHPLPADGMTVNISRITTGTATAIQATENAAAQETDIDDTLLTVNVRTIAGQQDVSRQAIDRSTGADDIVIADLVSAYNTNLDNQILNADGTSGTHLGIRSTVGIVAVTYTDTTPTPAELFPKFGDLIQQVQGGVFMGVTHFVFHPRRWWWLAVTLGTSFPLLTILSAGTQQAGQVGDSDYEGDNRGILGVPAVLDANIPTNLGAATNEDAILGVTAPELHLWEEANAPMFIRAEQTAAGNLTVKFVVWGYSAFAAGRYPGAHGTISGTGLVAPTF
jgi:HK97 family phage major capsid protein